MQALVSLGETLAYVYPVFKNRKIGNTLVIFPLPQLTSGHFLEDCNNIMHLAVINFVA